MSQAYLIVSIGYSYPHLHLPSCNHGRGISYQYVTTAQSSSQSTNSLALVPHNSNVIVVFAVVVHHVTLAIATINKHGHQYIYKALTLLPLLPPVPQHAMAIIHNHLLPHHSLPLF